jgi:nodulation protein E
MDTHLGTGAHRVVITGTGAVTAFGVGCTRFLQGMQAGACALKMQTIGNAGRSDDIVVGHVQDYDPTAYFSGPDLMYRDPFAQYALLATREAMAEAGLQRPSAETAHRYAVILGTGGGGEVAREDAGIDIFVHKKKRINPVVVPKTNHQASVGLISMEYGFTGPSMTINTGCASGSHAFIQSVINLRHGYADVAITGGSEGNAVFSVLLAFKSARTLSQDTCRPFSKERSGFILGEGAGVLVLETLAHALKRGATPLAEVIGCGMSSDAGDIVRPSVQGPMWIM